MSARIVIAEDEQDIRTNLSRMLRLEGFEVWSGQNGLEALELIRQHVPDLVLSDVMMPEMTGHQLIQAVRHNLGAVGTQGHQRRERSVRVPSTARLEAPMKREKSCLVAISHERSEERDVNTDGTDNRYPFTQIRMPNRNLRFRKDSAGWMKPSARRRAASVMAFSCRHRSQPLMARYI